MILARLKKKTSYFQVLGLVDYERINLSEL